ncbi:MAG: hypothetical protein QXH91_02510, partial [Candidatus Bathyarchaeia archaeon]
PNPPLRNCNKKNKGRKTVIVYMGIISAVSNNPPVMNIIFPNLSERVPHVTSNISIPKPNVAARTPHSLTETPIEEKNSGIIASKLNITPIKKKTEYVMSRFLTVESI